ncbi:MAG: pyridoxal-phosphate dependent enzyme [Thiovulaceae bacterium]|nr:pyridoxal-phosphate dependent enzyme [Sulfurimonadaceae bacterium]
MWKNLNQKLRSAINNFKLHSKVETLLWENHPLYVKRDDLLDPYLSGNKLRKLYYFLDKDLSAYKQIVSYGGLQSNAMLSIARLAQLKGLAFTYYVRYLSTIDEKVESNFSLAKSLGMKLEVMDAKNDEALGSLIKEKLSQDTLFMPQGGADANARFGLQLLAQEILAWKEQEGIEQLYVATPSGTGTTALWLQTALEDKAKVLTTAVVGDSDYLLKQMHSFGGVKELPTILENSEKFSFAKPHPKLFTIYQSFLDHGIEFDLIYAPVMFDALLENKKVWEEGTLLYVHSGGVLGNASQKARYKKKV